MKHTNGNLHVKTASELTGNEVVNPEGESLGNLEEIVIDTRYGKIAYAVLSFGGFLGLGNKLFAVPWESLALDKKDEKFVLSVDKDLLKEAEGFDKDNWPNMTDRSWADKIYSYYGYNPYWI